MTNTSTPPQLTHGGAIILPQWGERHHEFDPATGSLDELDGGVPGVTARGSLLQGPDDG